MVSEYVVEILSLKLINANMFNNIEPVQIHKGMINLLQLQDNLIQMDQNAL
jgi:hypothetical protein